MALRKIAYLTPLYFDEKSCLGGGERYPLNLATGVVHASGGTTQVDLISFGEKSFSQVLRPGVTLRVLRADNTPKNRLDVVSWELPAAIAEADLVHIHMAFARPSEVGLLLAKQMRKPVCITDHGGMSSTLGLDLGFLDLADRVIAYSEFGASLLWTKAPIEVVKGGVDGSAFTPPARRPKRDRVLYVGRLLPHKGIDRLIEALPPDVPLTICGRPYRHDFDWRMRHLAVGKQVEFIEDADDAKILDLYHRAWVNVLPSVYKDCFGQTYVAPELMGLTLLEAMACGTPAICSRVGAMPEFVRHGETGFVFDTLDELSEQLRLLATNPELVEEMGQRGRQAVEQEFDLRVVGRKMLDIYRGIAREAREAAA